jgi:hypothetical protein
MGSCFPTLASQGWGTRGRADWNFPKATAVLFDYAGRLSTRLRFAQDDGGWCFPTLSAKRNGKDGARSALKKRRFVVGSGRLVDGGASGQVQAAAGAVFNG